MQKIEKSLSKKVMANGKSQVMLRITLIKDSKIRLKTNVFVRPLLFDETIGDIVIPQRGKYFDVDLYNEAIQAKSNLDAFIARICNIISLGTFDDTPVNKEWIDHVMSLQDNPAICLSIHHLSLIKIEDAIRKENEIEANKKALQEEKEREEAKEKTELSFALDVFLKHQKLCDGRVRSYKVLKGMIQRFTMFKREMGKKDFALYLDSMTLDDVEEFREYVRNEDKIAETHKRIFKHIFSAFPLATNPDKPREIGERGENYIISVMKRVKAVVNWHLKQGTITNNPLIRMEIGRDRYGDPLYITKEERDRIADFDLSTAPESIQRQRDIFIFQCLIGCRVGDLLTMTSKNINNGVLEYIPHKTKDHAIAAHPRVPLSQRALDLIAKYDGVDNHGRLFPFISAKKYNEYIREVFKLCKIDRMVSVRNSVTGEYELKPICDIASSHMARRTFIGAAYKVVKDPNLIGKMSGHVEGSKAFNRYRDIDIDDLKSVISAIN